MPYTHWIFMGYHSRGVFYNYKSNYFKTKSKYSTMDLQSCKLQLRAFLGQIINIHGPVLVMIDISKAVSCTKMKHIDPCNFYMILYALLDIKKEFDAIKPGIRVEIRNLPIIALKDTPLSHVLNL